jgi:antibiotic biosynthesis monooxygenase (ABM) superfamily enzyme
MSQTLSLPAPAGSQPRPPSIHARALITWLAIFPLVTIGFFAIEPFAGEWNPIARAFVLSIVVVPLAVYLVVPQLMRAYQAIGRARRR